MRYFIENHTEPNSTVADWKEAIKTSFGITYYNDMLVEILQQYATFYWVYELQEMYMYGSSRLGSVQRNLPLVQQVLNSDSLIYYSYMNDSIRYMERGQKRFELSNHLGNVLAVVTDRKLVHCSGEELMWFEAQIVSVTDYYPFGMEIKERTYSVSSYRYGFQGQEKDDEIKGAGNSINYKYRMHDPRLGRFFAVDPLVYEFAYNSPYAFSENRVIDACELEGLETNMQWKTIGDGFAIWFESMASIFRLDYSIELGFKSQTNNNNNRFLTQSTSVSVGMNVGLNITNVIRYSHQYGSTSEPLVKCDIFFKSSITDFTSISVPNLDFKYSTSNSYSYSYVSMETSNTHQENISLNIPTFKFGLELKLLDSEKKSSEEYKLNFLDYTIGSENKSMFNAKASAFFETQKNNTPLDFSGLSNSIGISCSLKGQVKVGESTDKSNSTTTNYFINFSSNLKIGLNL